MQKSNLPDFAATYNGVFALMLAGVLLYLAALPPLGLWWLGWIVAACWTPLIRRKTLLFTNFDEQKSKSPKQKRTWFRGRPYRQIWLAGVIFWGVTVHWVCFPHWAACFGWFAMCCYLGSYFPLFVFFARILHHQPLCGNLRLPAWFAAPVAWLAVMYLQKTLMGGFGFALLEHTQVRQTMLIQTADIGGESLVGAIMIFVGILFGECLPVRLATEQTDDNHFRVSVKGLLGRLGVIITTFIVLICYAEIRDRQRQPSERPPLNVALLQGSYKVSLSAPVEWYYEVFENYKEMALKTARDNKGEIDVIIWPESICRYSWEDIDVSELHESTRQNVSKQRFLEILSEKNSEILEISQLIGIPNIYGTASYIYSEKKDRYFGYNSALLIENVYSLGYDLENQQQLCPTEYSRYDKMLLVMFGEYIPFAEYLPDGFFLKTLCQRADFGKKPVAFVLRKTRDHESNQYVDVKEIPITYVASANICFESSSSRVPRCQILELKKQGQEPDFLINISNDGWFHHSSQIDLHLATHVFRAVENRKPYLAATNGGFSVGIDGSGRILDMGRRNSSEVVLVAVSPDSRHSCYHILGNLFHFLSLGLVGVIVLRSIFFHMITKVSKK